MSIIYLLVVATGVRSDHLFSFEINDLSLASFPILFLIKYILLFLTLNSSNRIIFANLVKLKGYVFSIFTHELSPMTVKEPSWWLILWTAQTKHLNFQILELSPSHICSWISSCWPTSIGIRVYHFLLANALTLSKFILSNNKIIKYREGVTYFFDFIISALHFLCCSRSFLNCIITTFSTLYEAFASFLLAPVLSLIDNK